MGAKRALSSLRVTRPDTRPFWRIPDLAEYLSLSRRSVEYLIARGEIPSCKFGGQRRVAHADVEAYVARNREVKA